MGRPLIDVPPVVRSKALALGADDWLRELPARVEELAARRNVTLGPVLPGGTQALVIDAGDAVLKLGLPTAERAQELTVLRLAGGDGCGRDRRIMEPLRRPSASFRNSGRYWVHDPDRRRSHPVWCRRVLRHDGLGGPAPLLKLDVRPLA